MKRLAAGVLAVGVVALPACSGESGDGCATTDLASNSEDSVVVAGDPWSGYAPFRDDGFDLLDGTQYEAVYVEQLCQDHRADDLGDGKVDFILTTLDQYIKNQPAGAVVGVVDQSTGADALVLNKTQHPWLDGANDVAQLVDDYADRGEKPVLAYTADSPSEMLLNELANTTETLHLDDFELVGVDQSASALEMMDNDEAQLAVLWEPDTTTAVSNGDAVALSSADVPNAIVDVLVASDQVIEQEPQMVQAVIDSFYSRMDEYLADPEQANLIEMIARDGDFARDDARSVVEGIELYSTADAHKFLNEPLFPLDQPQMAQSLDSIGSLLALLHPDVDVNEARIDGSFVEQLYEEKVGDT